MSSSTLFGALVVALAGFLIGTSAWPIKVLRKYEFEHWLFVGEFLGLVVFPWTITLAFCPHAFAAYRSVEQSILIKSNIFALCWGIANVLCCLCYVRIGVALTGAVLAGLGVSVGVTMPMLIKGTGLFSKAPAIWSPAGRIVLVGVAVMLIGVALSSAAGFGRDHILNKQHKTQGNFLIWLILTSIAGILSCGLSFAFVYSQGPVVEALKAQGAASTPATFGVWAIGLMGGALVNILYPAYLMTKHKSWHILVDNTGDFLLASCIGVTLVITVVLMGKGMLMLGAMGASVGFGIQQALQMLGCQSLGFVSGEWKGIHGKPVKMMQAAIATLIIATLIMAYGNSLL
ncbi:hypothetical protein LLG46_12940 [bacterium]|nr:hypothetical protein [bacterium]